MENGSLSTKCVIAQLANFETMKWGEIKKQTHDKSNKTCNHIIEDLSKLCNKAQKRLDYLNISGNLFSLRLTNKTRIYGVLESRVLEILWYDKKHEIYPVKY